MESDNPTGADNQQETASPCFVLDPNWIVGFVDGEGCFSVAVHRSSIMHRHGGWQLQPVFHVYQHQDHRNALDALVRVFKCGKVRPKGPEQQCLDVRSRRASKSGKEGPSLLRRSSTRDQAPGLQALAEIVRSMRNKEHLSQVGFERLVRLAYGMNANGKQRSRTLEQVLAGSSETAREAPVAGQAGYR